MPVVDFVPPRVISQVIRILVATCDHSPRPPVDLASTLMKCLGHEWGSFTVMQCCAEEHAMLYVYLLDHVF
jgi:hypothetical protein